MWGSLRGLFDAIRYYPKGQRTGISFSLFLGFTVRQNARNIVDFSNPASVCFLFGFDVESHIECPFRL